MNVFFDIDGTLLDDRSATTHAAMAFFKTFSSQLNCPAVAFGSVWEELLKRTGILERFSTVVISEGVGASKPAPEIFLEACRRGNVRPSDVVYVGDRFEDDAVAAHAAGLKGAWLDRAGEGRLERNDIGVVTSLAQLADAMESND